MSHKVLAILLLIVGYLSIFVENDATGFIVCIMFGIPVLFAKEET